MSDCVGRFPLDTVCQGDALALLPELPEASVDLIVTDPPFAIDFRDQRNNYNRTGARVLPGYREIGTAEYGEFTGAWMREAFRVLRETGSLYVFSGWNHLKEILTALDASGFTTVNHLIWKYQFGVFTRRKYVTSHYHILFAVKDRRRYYFNKVEHYPEDVWVVNREYWTGRIKTPTKLPLQLVERILPFSSRAGDLVLDPFLGSGTVAVAAKRMGRHYLGFEIVPEYCDLARERLENGGPP
ncbi:MAG: site-specific DNA-methyltransferase [Methanomicrobiales archaeon]|nr:site-specific DNA-methyltransferase [Methanomicrobiales archaeon]MDI6875650.1 site-specific DNA-methyltransferase [Methanomicrobiales archaeon]